MIADDLLCKDPGQQQSYYWPSYARIFRFSTLRINGSLSNISMMTKSQTHGDTNMAQLINKTQWEFHKRHSLLFPKIFFVNTPVVLIGLLISTVQLTLSNIFAFNANSEYTCKGVVLCYKQVSRAGTSNYIPRHLWNVNYLSLPLILAADTTLLIWGRYLLITSCGFPSSVNLIF